MPDTTALALFVATAIAILITPGPAVLYIVARSVDQGRLAGIVSTLGVHVGTLIHVTAAALGISALLVSSAFAFSVVKLLGAAYLVYLGVRKFMEGDTLVQPTVLERKRLREIFLQGVIVNVLNPKTALFFLAFLPQFVDVSKGQVALQVVFLGGLFVVLGIFSDGLYAVLAGGLGGWLKRNVRLRRAQRYFAGGVFVSLGIAMAFAESGRE